MQKLLLLNLAGFATNIGIWALFYRFNGTSFSWEWWAFIGLMIANAILIGEHREEQIKLRSKVQVKGEIK